MTEGSTLWGRAVEAEPRGAALTAARSSRPAHAGWRKPILGLLAVGLFTLTPLLGAACGGSTAATTLTVFAASSLTDAFTKLGADYTAAHPGVKVVFNFTGSQDLVAQIQQGAPADVFASADPTSMAAVSGQVGAPTVFAGNQLEIVVAPGNPKGIRTLADLADPGPKVVLAAPEVPAGKYAQQALAQAKVKVFPVSLEENVKGVVTKVSLGEADAGIAYVTDVTAAKGKVDGVTIPAALNVTASYPVATLDATKHQSDAQAFVDLVLSPQGQRTLRGYGFLPPPTP